MLFMEELIMKPNCKSGIPWANANVLKTSNKGVFKKGKGG